MRAIVGTGSACGELLLTVPDLHARDKRGCQALNYALGSQMASGEKSPSSSTDRPRAALRFQAAELVEDLMVHLRRQMKE
jgi:hypothetical protein